MITKTRLQIVLTTLVLTLASTQAFAAGGGATFSLVGVGDMSYFTQSFLPADPLLSAPTYSRKLAYGAGLLVGLPLGSKAQFEVGALYVQRKGGLKYDYDLNADATDGFETPIYDKVITSKYLEFPVGLRFLANKYLSLGAGLQFSREIGNQHVVDNLAVTESDEAPTGLRNSWGVYGSLGIGLPVGKSVSFLIDARYLYGLTNTVADTSTGEFKNRDYQALVGFRFGGGAGK